MDLSLRNSSFVGVADGDVSVAGIAARHGMSAPYSLRQLLSTRDTSIVQRWALVLIVCSDTTPQATMPLDWYDKLIFDLDGIQAFVRRMSGGRARIECQFFGPLSPLTLAQKQQAANAGMEPTIYRQAARDAGVELSTFHRIMWIMDDSGQSQGGVLTGGGDTFVGGVDLSPALICQEIIHTYNVAHADRTVENDYGDTFCVMGDRSVARNFDHPALAWPGQFNHALTGPAVIAPSLFGAGWLNYQIQVVGIVREELPDYVGTAITLHANQGAPPPGSYDKIAVAVGSPPTHRSHPPQLWVEYRRPVGFDREIVRPRGAAADLPSTGGLVVHSVTYGTAQVPAALHTLLTSSHPAQVGVLVPLPGFDRRLEVLAVNGDTVTMTVR
jgi:hypothetical protein